MNQVIMMGRICKDPEISSSASGTKFARYSIAVDRKYKTEGGPDADFFNCSSFGKQAQFVENYIKKGTKVVISGELQNNNYTNKEGHKVYDVKIVVHDIEFAESKNSSTETKKEEKNDMSFLQVEDISELPFS